MPGGTARSPNRGLLVCSTAAFASISALFLLGRGEDDNLAQVRDANEGPVGSNAFFDCASTQPKRRLLHTMKHNLIYGQDADAVQYMGQAF